MAWRGVHLTQPSRLSLADGQLVVAQTDGEARLALEDIAWLVIDTPQATLTTALLSACMESGIAVTITDARHVPSGLMLPFARHHRHAEVGALQLATSAPLRKRLWQTIVRAKIANQAAALERCGGDAAPLRAMLHLVGSGDPENVEARAARHYWSRLMRNFVRERGDDRRNMLLNYGYAVIRSAVARGVVGAGLWPALGVNHASAANAFNLADDLVEPFRPFVDVIVWDMSEKGAASEGDATVADRRALAAIPTHDAWLGSEQVTLVVAAERVAASLVRSFETKRPGTLELPTLTPAA